MNSVAIKTDFLKVAVKKVKAAIKLDSKKTTSVTLSKENKDLFDFLQDNFPLSTAQTTKINGFYFGATKLEDVKVDSVTTLFNAVSKMNGSDEPTFEAKINGKWYPVLSNIVKFKGKDSWFGELTINGGIGSINYHRRIFLGDWLFEDASGKKAKKSINEVLKHANLRLTSPEAVAQCKTLTAKLFEFLSYENKVFDATGVGLVYNEYWGWSDISVGWKDAPSAVVIEPTLENEHINYDREVGWKLPFVRVFSLKHKDYVFVDIQDLETHTYHKEGKDKIFLPPKMMTAINSIFDAKQDNIFGDLFHGRHGGIVVLANGPSGVGKTLTAEVFAEYQGRPLYTMEMGEVGTNLDSVEMNLNKIFARAKKWNAVLLFDEADIFLSERVASDLERSAIVGIFLRLLDYYEGTFFLTTNRGEGIDKAFKSRVTLYLNYPDLTEELRSKIWVSMLKAANISIIRDSRATWEQITGVPLNGRQIRNQVRLLRLMHPDGNVSTLDIQDSLEFAAK